MKIAVREYNADCSIDLSTDSAIFTRSDEGYEERDAARSRRNPWTMNAAQKSADPAAKSNRADVER